MSTPLFPSRRSNFGRRSTHGPSISRALNSASSTSISAPRRESDLERKLLDRVGSYGRQIGRIGDALEVILKHVKLGELKPEEQDALDILKGQLAAVRQVKAGHSASDAADASSATQSQAR